MLSHYIHKLTPRLNVFWGRLRNFFGTPRSGILTAFYDLGEYPASYDIVYLTLVAQARALESGLRGIQVFLVSGKHFGLRKEDPEYESSYHPDQRNYVVSQVLETVPRMARNCGRSALRIDSSEVSSLRAMFPSYYALHMENQWNPLHRMRLEAHTAWIKHGNILGFTASFGAKKLMIDWLAANDIGTSPIVLIIRDRKWSRGRNTSGGDWLEFIRIIRERNVPIVAIPDTERVFEKSTFDDLGVPVCIPASINTELRLALCELARMNFSVCSGPGTMLLFTRAPYRFYANLDKSDESASSLWTKNGLPPGSQLAPGSKSQKIVWEDDSIQNLMTEFEWVLENIPDQKL
jgi:hypothetical protein